MSIEVEDVTQEKEEPSKLGVRLEQQIQTEMTRAECLRMIAHVTEGVVSTVRARLDKDGMGLVPIVEKRLGLSEALSEMPVPKEAVDKLLGIVVGAVADVCLSAVLAEATNARNESLKVEGSIQARKELLSQLRAESSS